MRRGRGIFLLVPVWSPYSKTHPRLCTVLMVVDGTLTTHKSLGKGVGKPTIYRE